jgi:hypothetical protein
VAPFDNKLAAIGRPMTPRPITPTRDRFIELSVRAMAT